MMGNKTVQPARHRHYNPKRRTITKDLTICLVLVVIVVSTVAIGTHYVYSSIKEEHRLERVADEYQSYLEESLELPIWTLDRKFTTKIAESYFNNELIEMIRISEKFYDSNRKPYDKVIFEKSKSDDSDLVFRDFDIRYNGKKIGAVRFGLTRRFYQKNLHQLLVSNTIILFMVVLSLISLTAVLIRRFVKKPLNSLIQGINQISRGNYAYELKHFKQYEIQSIITDFKYMADRIRNREESLADMNRQLSFEVNARKKVETAIRSSEAQLSATFEASSDGILVTDNNGDVIKANDRFFQMWQMPEDFKQLKNDSALNQFMRNQLKDPESYDSKSFENGKETFEELSLKDGRVFERVCCPLVYSETNYGSVTNFRDVTDLKASIKALRESEDRFRQLSEAALEAIVIHDNGIILQVNDRFLKIFGYKRQEVIGKLAFKSVIVPEFKELFYPETMRQNTNFMEIQGVRQDGTFVPIIIQSKEMVFYGKTVFVSVIRDVSDRKAAEAETKTLKEKLAKSKKMEALGLLAGGVAHDLNNILSGIVSYPELLLMKKGLDPKMRKALKVIQESGERAAAVVNDLTTISRGIASNREVISLNSIVREYLISPEFSSLKLKEANIELKTDLSPDLANIDASRIHVRKSIMNLVLNASEAIEKNGCICISTENRLIEMPLHDIKPGTYAVLSVLDNGSGISPEEADRIFEPFYTKKVLGRSGTGLGLTVVWNTVQDHNGYVTVSCDQHNTRFDMYFPITEKRAREQIKKCSVSDFSGESEKILVVDDEKNQRDIACEMLRTLGYTPDHASSGEAAVEKIRNTPFDLVVLDMIMPNGMNGLETYRQILTIHPKQKAIIASGFSINENVAMAQKLGAGQFLQKPYTIEGLGLAVKKELRGK